MSGASRHGLQPDERVYGVLISVVGAANLPTALDLQEELRQSGVVPLRVSRSSSPCRHTRGERYLYTLLEDQLISKMYSVKNHVLHQLKPHLRREFVSIHN